MEDSDVTGELLPTLLTTELPDEDVWLSMFTSVSSHSGCPSADVAAAWADVGLSKFRSRFRRVDEEVGRGCPVRHH